MVTRRTGMVDTRLRPVLHDLTPLHYTRHATSGGDVPPYVRAASAARYRGSRLVIVQDDVNVLALHDHDGHTEAVLLPAGEGGRRVFDDLRGNKHAKMDLEACAALPDGRLVAFGSGSTPARERLVVVGAVDSGAVDVPVAGGEGGDFLRIADGGTQVPVAGGEGGDLLRIVDGGALYAALRAVPGFVGSEMNLEGALVVGTTLYLFQRGNGAPGREVAPVNATCRLPLAAFLAWLDAGAAVPSPEDVVQYDLGAVQGIPFTFTDAAAAPGGSVAFLACAEDSPDATRDGEVVGCRFGIIEDDAVRVAEVRRPDGSLAIHKLEGIEPLPGVEGRFVVVVDDDDPEQPAHWGRLEVAGMGRGARA